MLNELRNITWKKIEKNKKDSIFEREKQIKKYMNNDIEYSKYINIKIKDILVNAKNNIEFYKKIESNNLKDFPIINKNIIINNYNNFKNENYKDEKLYEMSTSGSTGIPFKIQQNIEKKNQVSAEVIYFSSLVGYKIGKHLIYLRNLEKGFQKSKLKKFIQNEKIIYTQKYSKEVLENIVKQISKSENETTILGYASSLNAIANYMKNNNIVLKNVTGIISGAEAITDKTRNLLKETFNNPIIVSRYSNQEMGILAQEIEKDKFILNRASYYFELLNINNDQPAKNGEMGRIVITDLYNEVMPLIRYDTGDIGIMEKDENGNEYLSKVCGRKLDLLYTTQNEPITFFALDDFLETNYDILQYQIVQESRIDFTINLIMRQNAKINENQLIEKCKTVFGEESKINIKYLNETPITSSGKFRYVICNYKPDIIK